MTVRNLTILAILGSAGLLAGAFLFQTLGYAPCKLCIWQRWPHGAAIGFGLLWLLAPLGLWLIAGALSTLTSAAIGFYHTGVEKGIFEGPTTCTSGNISDLSTDQLFDQIMSAPLIRCDEVSWALFSLSMASWNMILSAGLAGIWIFALVKSKPAT